MPKDTRKPQGRRTSFGNVVMQSPAPSIALSPMKPSNPMLKPQERADLGGHQSASSTSSSSLFLSDAQLRDAWNRLYKFSLACLSDTDLVAETEYWTRSLMRSVSMIQAGEFEEGDETFLQNGIDHCELRLVEIQKEAERRLRVRHHPAYPATGPIEDLSARFEAARYCDLVGLAEMLTGQQAIKTGNGRYRIRCPFHAGGQEKTPSLVIYPPGKGWHCFSCGRGNDAVGFVRELQGGSAVEALRLVEQIADTYPESWMAVPS